MKHLLNQVMSAAGALLCVLAFWVATELKTTDATVQLVLIAVPAALIPVVIVTFVRAIGRKRDGSNQPSQYAAEE
jgi:hypothetical protein